jgi:hypothetical protein
VGYTSAYNNINYNECGTIGSSDSENYCTGLPPLVEDTSKPWTGVEEGSLTRDDESAIAVETHGFILDGISATFTV